MFALAFGGAPLALAMADIRPRGTDRVGTAAQAVRVVAREVPLVATPEPNATRRGTLRAGAAATIFGRHRSSGCNGDWLLVGPAAWTCNLPGLFEARASQDRQTPESWVAITYARISANGAIGYASFERAEQQLPDAELQPGFLLALVEVRSIHGEDFARTTHDIWIAKRELIELRPGTFEGVEIGDFAAQLAVTEPTNSKASATPSLLAEGHLPIGWVFVDRAVPRRSVAGQSLPQVRLSRLTRVRVLAVHRHHDRHEWYQIAEGWLSDQQLRVPTVSLPPDGIGASERWLDVDKHRQTLVAYVGGTPVFATLVSTGRGPEDGPTATPSGLHRIWVKLTSTDMDNLDQQNSASDPVNLPEPYAVEAVPHVMFFLRGYGLHATYWHDAFGTPQSHGCINLSPHDAERLFDFTSPRLAPGWQAVHPYAHDPGTLVRVRSGRNR